MNFQKIFVPVAILGLVAWSFFAYGFKGLVVSVGVLTMWFLLHWTRTMQVLRRAAERPIGYVASAVMLNAKLKPGVTLLHVVAMTRALGELRSVPDVQPETYRWTDSTDSHVTAEFKDGRLVQWVLYRPSVADDVAQDGTSTPVE